ncbi:MAG: glycosyltransferase family 2 protein [Pseudomonadota bacterium]
MTEPNAPTVDVIITCYNEGDFVEEAVASVLSQTGVDRVGRIVIADDGSEAETRAVLERIEAEEPRAQVIYGPGGAGPARQRNLAVEATGAPYVAFLDADDYWTPAKLAAQLPLLDADADVGLVYTDYFAFSDGNPAAARQAGAVDLSGAEDQTRAYFLNDPPILPSTVVLRRAAFDRAGRFDAAIAMFEETDLWLRMSRVCRFGFVAAPHLYKRFRAQSMTGTQRDLMPDHALVAAKAVGYAPDLLELVPRRLSERARKLGNHRFLQGDKAEAARLLRLAVRLDPSNARAWPYWAAATLFPALSNRLLAGRVRKRRDAIGAGQ